MYKCQGIFGCFKKAFHLLVVNWEYGFSLPGMLMNHKKDDSEEKDCILS